MESLARFVFDTRASQLTVHAFASGLVAVVAHNPKFAVRDFSAEAKFMPRSLAQASLRVKIQVASLTLLDEVSEYDQREIQRVMFDEVLAAKSFPEIVFESSRVTTHAVSENLYRATIDGNLTLHGITNTLSFNAQVVVGEDSLRSYGDFSVRQTDYGIQTASVAGGSLKMKDEVKVTFFMIAIREG